MHKAGPTLKMHLVLQTPHGIRLKLVSETTFLLVLFLFVILNGFLFYTVLLTPFLLRIPNLLLTEERNRDKAEIGARKQTLKMGL